MRRRLPIAFAVCLFIAGCGGEAEIHTIDGDDSGLDDAGPVADTGSTTTNPNQMVAPPDGGMEIEDMSSEPTPDMPSTPMPKDLAPCSNEFCWETSLGGPPCGVSAHDEDFSSGNYGVHAYSSFVWDGVATSIAVESTGGTWVPTVVVTDVDGAVLFDGAVGLTTGPTRVDARGAAELTIESDVPVAIVVHVTTNELRESNFGGTAPTDITYTLTIDSDCGERVDCVVNGNGVREPACGWLHYVGRTVVPRLEGTRDERLTAAARVAWWSLKEGVMFLDNPIVYSNCNFPDGDARIGPLEECVPDRAWQVGLAGVQVPYQDKAEVEQLATTLYPGMTVEDVLERTAEEARVDAATKSAVVSSAGDLRHSWLLRNSAIGFTREAPVVTRECVDDTRSWCYGTGWDTTRLYAPNRTAALGAIDDVRALLGQIAP